MKLQVCVAVLSFGFALSAVAEPSSLGPQESIARAISAARVEPSLAEHLNAMQVWAFSPAALYQIYTRPGRVTDIVLQAGEDLLDISTPDPIRWIVGSTTSGQGKDLRVHISIKPIRADLRTNLIVYTSRRTYYLEVSATPSTWMAAVTWNYPLDSPPAAVAVSADASAAGLVADAIRPDQLNFDYRITGPRRAWRPIRVFDDGSKTYIQFSRAITQNEMPPLFLRSPRGDAQLVNYRVRSPFYVVDRLFSSAELRLGTGRRSVVRITRASEPAHAIPHGQLQ